VSSSGSHPAHLKGKKAAPSFQGRRELVAVFLPVTWGIVAGALHAVSSGGPPPEGWVAAMDVSYL